MTDTPALTAEGRAKQVLDGVDSGSLFTLWDCGALEAAIASAIREAEDTARQQALEGAACCFDQIEALLSADQVAWAIRDLVENPPDWNLKPKKGGCGCGACSATTTHASDCAVHNAPALPIGPCDCAALKSQKETP